MSDVDCPYCGAGQDINHDDGYGFDEDGVHEQQCASCDMVFAYTTSIVYYHDARKADCLNGADHRYEPTRTYPKRYTKMHCADCGDIRSCTDEEMAMIMGEDKQ